MYLEIDFKLKHDLIYLLNLISIKDKFSDEYYQMALKLEDYGVQIRYPDYENHPSDEEIQEAIQIAESFADIIRNKLPNHF